MEQANPAQPSPTVAEVLSGERALPWPELPTFSPFPLFFYVPTNRRDYLRLLLLQELIRDPHGPLQTWLNDLEGRLRDRAIEEAYRWWEEWETKYQKEVAQDATTAFEIARERLGISGESANNTKAAYHASSLRAERIESLTGYFGAWLRSLLDSEETPESLATGDTKALGEEFAKHLAREPRDTPLKEDDIRLGLYRACEALAYESELRRQAEGIAYSLHVHTMPHEWLTQALLWEAKEAVNRVVPLPPMSLPQHPLPTLPPWVPSWRQEHIDLPRKVDVRVVIYDDEDADAAKQKLDEAKETLKEIRRRPPGPTQKPPADDELMRLFYRSLKGESYRDLASGLSGDHSVHYKTLARHLRRVRGTIFSPEE